MRKVHLALSFAASLLTALPSSALAHAGSAPKLAEGSELEAQPHMRASLATLQAAEQQLEKASHDKGGHRVKALGYVKTAISEVKKGVAYDNATPKLARPDDAVTLADSQPHMKAALKLLQTAKSQLEKASHDKGGHRVKALKAVTLALTEVKQGIAYDSKH